jgi:hypothetical protein
MGEHRRHSDPLAEAEGAVFPTFEDRLELDANHTIERYRRIAASTVLSLWHPVEKRMRRIDELPMEVATGEFLLDAGLFAVGALAQQRQPHNAPVFKSWPLALLLNSDQLF